MPTPTPKDVHFDSVLTNLSVAYMNQGTFIADTVFPSINVAKQSNLYRTYSQDTFMRGGAKKRAPGTETPGIGWGSGMNRYHADVWGLHVDIDDQTRANADGDFDLDRMATQLLTQRMLMTREIAWGERFFTTGVWANDHIPTNKWSSANGKPIEDVLAASTMMQRSTGFRPNKLIVGPDVDVALTNHPEIIDRLKYTSSQSVTREMIRQLLNVDQYIVADAVANVGPEIVQPVPGLTFGPPATNGTTNYLFGGNALLCYAPAAAGLLQPSCGYTFNWSGLFGATQGIRVMTQRLEPIKSDRVEAEMAYDQRVVAPNMGFFFSGVADVAVFS